MVQRDRLFAWSLPAFLALTGCATVTPGPDYERVAKHVAEATGQDSIYQPGDDDLVDQKVEELLADGISAEEGVQICLLNNPSLQAEFLSVGMARADVVQSELFSNPSLGLSFRLPEGGGRSNLEASIAQNIADLWQIPVRKRVAGRALDAAILSLARRAAQLAGDAKEAYYAAVGAERTLAISRQNLELAQQLLDTALARQDAGVVGELDVNLARGTVLNAELEVQQARLDADGAKRRLAVLLGLTLWADEVVLLDDLPPPPITGVNADRCVEIALANRLDLRAARAHALAARDRIHEAYLMVFPDLEIGLELERGEKRSQQGRNVLGDTARASVAAGELTAPEIQPRSERRAEGRSEIDVIVGPSIGLTLPIFDQNQAQIAKAKMAYEQAVKLWNALEQSVIQEARQAVDEAITAWNVARFYEDQLLPQAKENFDLTSEAYRAGRTSLIVVLDAERSFLAARLAHVQALQAAAVTLARLEQVTGRPTSVLLADEGLETEISAVANVPTQAADSTTQPSQGAQR